MVVGPAGGGGARPSQLAPGFVGVSGGDGRGSRRVAAWPPLSPLLGWGPQPPLAPTPFPLAPFWSVARRAGVAVGFWWFPAGRPFSSPRFGGPPGDPTSTSVLVVAGGRHPSPRPVRWLPERGPEPKLYGWGVHPRPPACSPSHSAGFALGRAWPGVARVLAIASARGGCVPPPERWAWPPSDAALAAPSPPSRSLPGPRAPGSCPSPGVPALFPGAFPPKTADRNLGAGGGRPGGRTCAGRGKVRGGGANPCAAGGGSRGIVAQRPCATMPSRFGASAKIHPPPLGKGRGGGGRRRGRPGAGGLPPWGGAGGRGLSVPGVVKNPG